MDDFGEGDPRRMPGHLFRGVRRMDYASAARADVSRQYCSVCPRYWYVDAAFACERCGTEFWFTAAEQRVWYEEYGFWIDSLPGHCLPCRRALRHARDLRAEYDRDVAATLASDDVDAKVRLAMVIDTLYELHDDLPAGMHEHRRRLARQISKG